MRGHGYDLGPCITIALYLESFQISIFHVIYLALCIGYCITVCMFVVPVTITTAIFMTKNRNWIETYFEVVSFISYELSQNPKNGVIIETQIVQGHCGLYDLANEWTNEFEGFNKGREWDGEFIDEIFAFCVKKNDPNF